MSFYTYLCSNMQAGVSGDGRYKATLMRLDGQIDPDVCPSSVLPGTSLPLEDSAAL
jgi:hypothetical protein